MIDMASVDLGIGLGTATVVVYDSTQGIVLKEPSVVAINTKTDEVLSVGEEAYRMLGRTPDKIRAVRPLQDGVISDFNSTEKMIQSFLRKVGGNQIIRPRVAICVPSGITEVESRAVVDAAVAAGARKVYLIEEPVAAALGAGIDISKPNGHIIVDIGGGTTDIAVLSLNGVVCKTSLKVAGDKFDQAIVRYVRSTYDVLIGEKMAERLKMEIGSVFFNEDEDISTDIKGRNLRTGLPQKLTITRSELKEVLLEQAMNIVVAVQQILEKTPPELAADISVNGLVMTGGGSMLHGLDRLISHYTKVNAFLAEDPVDCVAIGTGKAFQYLGDFFDGFVTSSTHKH